MSDAQLWHLQKKAKLSLAEDKQCVKWLKVHTLVCIWVSSFARAKQDQENQRISDL